MATAVQDTSTAAHRAAGILREAINLAAQGLHTAEDLHEALDQAEDILGIAHTARS